MGRISPRRTRPSLLDVHGALSALIHAVNLTLEGIPLLGTEVRYRTSTYLCVEVEVKERYKQQVIDRLSHGALVEGYDYRFSVSYPTSISDPEEWVVVSAYVDMHHDQKRVDAHRQGEAA